VSLYRRPLPSTNVDFLSAIMWDSREPTLESQAIDATLIHAQANANAAPNVFGQAQMIALQTGIFTAQSFDKDAHALDAPRVTGGPKALSAELSKFFITRSGRLSTSALPTPEKIVLPPWTFPDCRSLP
jgi:cytochrome c peroxidase